MSGRDVDKADELKRVLAWADSKWNTWGVKLRNDTGREIAKQYEAIKEEYWKDYAWTAITKYQRILEYVVANLRGDKRM